MRITTRISRLITQLPQPVLWGATGALGLSVVVAGVFLLQVSPFGGSITIVLGWVSLVVEYKLASLIVERGESERSERIAVWKDKQEIYTALRNGSDFVEVNKGNLDTINRLYSLRDRWYDLAGFSQEEKLLLISAGYAMETAEDAFVKLGLDALRVQAELSR
jgi:hypothetical protein